MADVDITSLSVEISAESSGAELNIDKLATAISNLRTKGNVAEVCDSLSKLTNSLATLKAVQVDFSGLESVSRFIEGIGKVNASESAKGINMLAKSMAKLPESLSGMNALSGSVDILLDVTDAFDTMASVQDPKGLRNAINAIKKIPEAISGVQGISSDLGDVKSVLDGFNNLPAVTAPEGLSSFVSLLRRIPKAVSEANSADYTQLAESSRQLMNGLAPLSVLDFSNLKNLGSVLNQLNKIPDLSEKLKTADLDAFTASCQKISTALTPLASQLDKVGNAFAKLPPQLSKVVTQANRVTAANQKASKSYMSLSSQVNNFMKRAAQLVSLKALATYIGNAVVKFNDFYEATDLFNNAMGNLGDEASSLVNKMQELLGIDPKDAMEHIATIQSLATSFGLASDKAYILSKNLTQLAYDEASYWNKDSAETFTAISSAISGELEPIRRLGVDLSQARLQQELLALGFNKQVSSLSQADKAVLRYIAIMKQTTNIQGNLAQTITSPANQIRMLKAELDQLAKSVGSLLYPALSSILPPLIAAVELIKEFVQWLGKLMGVNIQFTDFSKMKSDVGGVSDAMDDTANSTKKAAKALKDYTMGFDELNIIDPTQGSSGSGSGSGASGNILGDVDLSGYDMFKDYVGNAVDEIKGKLESLLPVIGSIGAGFLAWEISKGLIDALEKLSQLTIGIGDNWSTLGITMFIADMNEFRKYLEDFMENGATFENVAGMISEFAGMMGDAFLLLGRLKIAGALKVVQGIGEIIIVVKDISDNGVNWDNVTTLIRGLTNIATGIGLFTGNLQLAGWSIAIQGFTQIITELHDNWDAIKNGDWSGVDKATLVVGALEVLGGIATALGVFSKLKAVKESTEAVESVKTVAKSVEGVNSASSSLSPNLTSLAKNLGLGVAIIGEIAAAAVIFAGAVVVLGKELSAVGDAWQPVIDNAGTVAVAVATGTGLLAAIGTAAYALGTGGVSVATNIGIGTAILVEIGLAAVAFEADIWAVGTGLDEIRQAWQPVLDNASAVKKSVATGTVMLVAIGAVCAALGAATVASAGAIPIAIGLGTAVLAECAGSFVALTKSLTSVANELSQKLSPALSNMNEKLPALKKDMSSFTSYLKDFASEISSYKKSMGSITWSNIVGGFQKLFSGNPIASMADDVNTIYKDTKTLNDKLNLANPELKLAVELMTKYSALMNQLKILTDENGDIQLATGIFTNLKTAGEKLVTGFVSGIDSQLYSLNAEIEKIVSKTESIGDNTKAFETAGGNLMKGFIKGLDGQKDSVYDKISEIGKQVLSEFKSALDEHSPSKETEQYGIWFDQGFANGITGALDYVQSAVAQLANAALEGGTQLINSGMTSASNYVTGFLDGLDNQWKQIDSALQNDFSGSMKTLYNAIKQGNLEKLGSWAAAYFWNAMNDAQKNQIKTVAQSALTWLNQGLSSVWQNIASLASSYIGQLVPATATATGAQIGLNTAMDANPILFIISVIGMLAGALINLAGTNGDVANSLSSTWKNVFSVLSEIAEATVRYIGYSLYGYVVYINTIIWGFNKILSLFGKSVDYIESPFFKVADSIKAYRETKLSVSSDSIPGTSGYEYGSFSSYGYVSSSGGRSDENIRDDVYNGCYNAFLDIWQRYADQIMNGQNVTVVLDSKQITTSVEKQQSDRGMQIMGKEVYSY